MVPPPQKRAKNPLKRRPRPKNLKRGNVIALRHPLRAKGATILPAAVTAASPE
jgi:hypothetical protein